MLRTLHNHFFEVIAIEKRERTDFGHRLRKNQFFEIVATVESIIAHLLLPIGKLNIVQLPTPLKR